MTFRSRAGVDEAEVGAVETDCQSLTDGVGWDTTEVAAVELRALNEADEVVDAVSRLRL